MTLKDAIGNTLTTTTDGFGFYVFEDVPAGITYTLTPQLKLFVFTPQVFTVNDDTEVPNFVGQSTAKRGR